MEFAQGMTPPPTLPPHRRQFVVGPTPFNLDQTWRHCPIAPAGWLSHCLELRVASGSDASGKTWILLGMAIETRPERPAPLASIAQTETAAVSHLYTSWAGRWLLLGPGTVHLDASGLLGCFYGADQGGRTWASSSAGLLADIVNASAIDSRCLRYEVGISWYTPPRTRFLGLRRLLPSQVLHLPDGDIVPRPLTPAIQPERESSDTLWQIQTGLVTTLKQLPAIGVPIWLGLTAGYDSRLLLGLSQVAQIEVKPFTRIAARMSVADRLLPPQLAHTGGYTHTFLRRGKRFPERQALVSSHSGGQISAGDAEPFVRGDRDGLKGIAFGGHGFAIASGFYKLRDLPATLTSATEGAQQIANLFQEPLTSTATAGLQDWLEWVLAHPEPHLDWRDRFFLEQRQAGWLSTKEQVYDLTDLERFPILNCARLYSLLLSIPAEQRLGSKIQTELLQRVSPRLMAYPFNPSDFYFGPMRVIRSKAKDLPQYVLAKAIGKLRYFLGALTR